MSQQKVSSQYGLFSQLRHMRQQEEEQARSNPFLAKALEEEKRQGHRLAIRARTIALGIVFLLLPFLNSRLDVLFPMAMVLVFIALGWLQLRMSKVGFSRVELGLIFLDLVLLTLLFTVPNPFLSEEIPTAILYRFDTFIYFFVILAVATLAYSWRTVWAVGTWTALLWLFGLIGVKLFGHEMPELGETAATAFQGHQIVGAVLDPNSSQVDARIQEIVVFLIVAGILALKGWRSNQLVMKQANIAVERANLSRYFPSSLVDVLASTDHDIGAVRSQNVAVLFTDIVGFTQYAEEHSAEEVMNLLRGYHNYVERVIFQNGGTLDKYLGDGVMATFGTPNTSPQDAVNALKAAHQLMEAGKTFNEERVADGLEPIEVSVGVHYGPVILGGIGPSRRMEFAVVGDTVNVASRLESSTRELGCHCVVSEELVQQANADGQTTEAGDMGFQVREAINLRGRNTPIKVWTA